MYPPDEVLKQVCHGCVALAFADFTKDKSRHSREIQAYSVPFQTSIAAPAVGNCKLPGGYRRPNLLSVIVHVFAFDRHPATIGSYSKSFGGGSSEKNCHSAKFHLDPRRLNDWQPRHRSDLACLELLQGVSNIRLGDNSITFKDTAGGNIFATCDDSWLIECWKPHGLGFVELRVLKSRQS